MGLDEKIDESRRLDEQVYRDVIDKVKELFELGKQLHERDLNRVADKYYKFTLGVLLTPYTDWVDVPPFAELIDMEPDQLFDFVSHYMVSPGSLHTEYSELIRDIAKTRRRAFTCVRGGSSILDEIY